MKIGVTSLDDKPSAASIGFFDGVHRGHRYLIDQVREVARQRGLLSAVVTFPVHPKRVMQPGCDLRLLTTPQEKLDLLAQTGLDACLMMDFTPQLAALSARDFMRILKQTYRIEALVIGYDHRFGHNRAEGFDDYVRYGKELGMEVMQAKEAPVPADLSPRGSLSSSLIRRLLLHGDVVKAACCLGYGYFLQGTVVEGHRVGRSIGFPTANLRPGSPDKLVPANGVYAVRVKVEGETYGGMLCIGNRPTLHNGTDRSIEVHIFDFHRDIYGHPLRLTFVSHIREEHQFPSIDALTAQLRQDEQRVRSLLNEE